MVNLLRNVVNGKLLNQYNNKPVSIIGIVTNINPNGSSFDIRTTDNMTVPINLTSPLDDMLEGYVEVRIGAGFGEDFFNVLFGLGARDVTGQLGDGRGVYSVYVAAVQ